MTRRLVKWDGAIVRVRDVEDEELRIPEAFSGKVSAVSLNVMIFDAGGERLFERNGGVDLAHDLWLGAGEDGTLNATLRDPILEERRYLREGVALAFSPYLRRPRSSDW